MILNKSQTCAKNRVLLYVKRFNAQCMQQISGLGTFINKIESIGQDDCMTEQSLA